MSLKTHENQVKFDGEPRSAEQTLADLASIAFTEAGDPAEALLKMRGILDGSLRVSTLDPRGLVVTLRNEAPRYDSGVRYRAEHCDPVFFQRVQLALRVLEVAESGVQRWYADSEGWDNGNWLASELRHVLSGRFSVPGDVPSSLPEHPLDVPPDPELLARARQERAEAEAAGEHAKVRPFVEELAQRGNVTAAEWAVPMNTWERQRLLRALDDRTFFAHFLHCASNVGCSTSGDYNWSVVHELVPEARNRWEQGYRRCR